MVMVMTGYLHAGCLRKAVMIKGRSWASWEQRDCPTRRQNPLHQKCQGVPPGHTYLKRKYLWLHCQILEEQRRQNCYFVPSFPKPEPEANLEKWGKDTRRGQSRCPRWSGFMCRMLESRPRRRGDVCEGPFVALTWFLIRCYVSFHCSQHLRLGLHYS